ncbi:MAG: biotin/lipoyl-binding protein [Gammaproteobacteria bacterium]|nr:biotin/lipoyl-binding protein [Gammaproteobacteria bacterium]
MKRAVKVVLPILIVTAALAAFLGLKTSRPAQAPAQVSERVWRVETLRVEPGVLAPTLTLYGRLESPNLHRAAAPAAARVKRVLVREGDLVASGQLLLELDTRDFAPAVVQAQAEIDEYEAQLQSEQIRQAADLEAQQQEQRLLQLSRQSLERAHRLQKQQLGSDSELDLARQELARQTLSLTARERDISDHPARVQVLEAKVQRARARLQTAQLNLERSRVEAPHAGRIASVEVAVGNQVAPNQQLLTLYDPAALELRARIPTPYLGELVRSGAEDFALRGFIGQDAGRIELRLSRLAGEADPSGTDALFTLQRHSDWLRAGQVLSFNLQRQPQRDAFAVPHEVLYGGNRVYKLVEGRLQGVQVEPLGNYVRDDGEEWLLLRSDGLRAGEVLVATHLPNAVDGLRVAPVASP